MKKYMNAGALLLALGALAATSVQAEEDVWGVNEEVEYEGADARCVVKEKRWGNTTGAYWSTTATIQKADGTAITHPTYKVRARHQDLRNGACNFVNDAYQVGKWSTDDVTPEYSYAESGPRTWSECYYKGKSECMISVQD